MTESESNNINELRLSDSTIKKLNYYVYLLVDPRDTRDKKIFYVGKGKGERIYSHVLTHFKGQKNKSLKLQRIEEIIEAGEQVQHFVLRHGLTEKEAFEVESAAIDLIGKQNLTNEVKGYHADERGKMTLKTIKLMYEPEKVEILEPILLININRLFNPDMTPYELYEATRKHWKVNKVKAESVKFICSVYRGIIQEVYKPQKWVKSGEYKDRYMFEGEVATEDVRQKYLDKSVKHYWKKGSQNPIKYVNV